MSQAGYWCRLYLAVALTPVHVGVGRSPGVVDLPVARDAVGVPYIPGSALKGSLKSQCIRIHGSSPGGPCMRVFGWDIRFEGGEAGDAYMSPMTVGDAYVLFYPARVEHDDGSLELAYITSPVQLARLADALEACRHADRYPCGHAEAELCDILDAVNDVLATGLGEDGIEAFVNNVPARLAPPHREQADHMSRCLMKSLLDAAGNASRLAKLFANRVYIASPEDFTAIVEAGLLRQTRVRLDPARKTVEHGALWSEEYTPEATVYQFLLTLRRVEHPRAASPHEAARLLDNLLGGQGEMLFIGGKETIGKGLVKLAPILGYEGGVEP